MSTISIKKKEIALAVGALAFALGTGQALAAGFALQENSGSGLGNAFAGGAAAAEDASTVWANPAGMAFIGTNQVAGALHLITPSMKFSNGNSVAATNQQLGGNGGDAGSLNVVPNLYVVLPINKQWAFGLGINAPFGLVTEYDSDWIGRFQGIKSDVKTININPALSWRPVDNFAIGAGVSYQQLKGTFTSNANYSAGILKVAAAQGATPAQLGAIAQATPNLQAFADVTGDDWAWGWNVGALWEITKGTRLGVAWRSEISYGLSGNANISTPALPSTIPPPLQPTINAIAGYLNQNVFYSSGITSDIKVPGVFNASIFSTVNDKWDVMADVQWMNWSTIQYLTFTRTDNSPTPLVKTPLFFRDTWRFSVGANYKYSDQWMFRMGVAYDESPVQDADRTPRLPDSDRTWLSGGVQYKYGKQWKFDVGATYIWVNNGSINNAGNDPATNQPSQSAYGLINGSYSNNVVIFSGQVTYSF